MGTFTSFIYPDTHTIAHPQITAQTLITSQLKTPKLTSEITNLTLKTKQKVNVTPPIAMGSLLVILAALQLLHLW